MAFAGVGGVNLTNASSYELLRKKLAFGGGGEFRGRNRLTLKYGAISGGTEGRPLARRSGGWGEGVERFVFAVREPTLHQGGACGSSSGIDIISSSCIVFVLISLLFLLFFASFDFGPHGILG